MMGILAVAGTLVAATALAQEQVVRVQLAYRARGMDRSAPSPNFSPAGTRVPLTELPAGAPLPDGAARPARVGTIKLGPAEDAWLRVLAAADADHPKDLCRVYFDRDRNGDFADDGPPLTATPTAREKTGDMWSSFPATELAVPYGRGPQAATENYQVNVWIVRQGEDAPDLLRYSVGSWRSGAVTVRGVEALVAAFDSNNDAVFDKNDQWSVIEASAPDAAKQVLSYNEARPTSRMMFVKDGTKEIVLEFRSISTDGRSMAFAVVDRPVTKANDRAGDDTVREERPRPRVQTPFAWDATFDAGVARAKASGRKLILDFWTSWCGPCKTMDEWIWTDAEVVAVLNAGYAGVRVDGDLEKALVARFAVGAYPTVIVLDSTGKEITRFVGYKGSRDTLAVLAGK